MYLFILLVINLQCHHHVLTYYVFIFSSQGFVWFSKDTSMLDGLDTASVEMEAAKVCPTSLFLKCVYQSIKIERLNFIFTTWTIYAG